MSGSNVPTMVMGGVKEDCYQFIWKIQNFLLVQNDVEFLSKQKFEVEMERTPDHKTKWEIGFKLIKDSKDFYVYVKLIDCCEHITRVSTKCVVGLRNGDGSVRGLNKHQTSVSKGGQINSTVYYTHHNAEYWNSCLDSNEAVTFTVDISILEMAPMELPIKAGPSSLLALSAFKQNSISALQKHLSTLLTNVKDHDLKITCSDGKTLDAHSSILRSRCPIFDAMLSTENGYSESQTKTIELKDVTEKTMGILLQYFYTGELQPAWRDKLTIVEFIYAVGKYQLSEVLEFLDNILGNEDEECTLLMMNLAHKLSLKNAEAKLMGGIVKMTNATTKVGFFV